MLSTDFDAFACKIQKNASKIAKAFTYMQVPRTNGSGKPNFQPRGRIALACMRTHVLKRLHACSATCILQDRDCMHALPHARFARSRLHACSCMHAWNHVAGAWHHVVRAWHHVAGALKLSRNLLVPGLSECWYDILRKFFWKLTLQIQRRRRSDRLVFVDDLLIKLRNFFKLIWNYHVWPECFWPSHMRPWRWCQ